MTQKLATPLEQKTVGPHIRHVNPHPQYALAADVTDVDEEIAALQASLDALDVRVTELEAAVAAIPDMSDVVIGPSGGALFDIDHGELVWDVTADPPVQVFV